jgi:hypothetical protein
VLHRAATAIGEVLVHVRREHLRVSERLAEHRPKIVDCDEEEVLAGSRGNITGEGSTQANCDCQQVLHSKGRTVLEVKSSL